MYEIMFDTRQFNNKAEWPADGSLPWYWSMGDNTGYGLHGDYLFGWKGDALQKAMDGKCSGDRCAPLQRQTDAQAIACTKSQQSGENIGDQWLTSLPGMTMPITLEPATPKSPTSLPFEGLYASARLVLGPREGLVTTEAAGGILLSLALSTRGPIECAVSGTVLLNTPYFNRGSAHTAQEREEFNLTGLLPHSVQTLEQQVKRAYEQYSTRPDDLAKNTFLTSLKEQNAVLYFRLLQDHLSEMFSVVYTPTEGDAIQNYSRLFRRPEGCFLNIDNVDRVSHDLAQWGRPDDIDYIVVSGTLVSPVLPAFKPLPSQIERGSIVANRFPDGEEILGIGDQGAGGILISVAKLVLTTLCAGIHPNRTLPVVLDCGTDNENLLNDELYLGLRKKRVRGEKYDKFVDEFVQSARKLFPKAYIHFEDFGLTNARRILDHYRPEIPCFNDDVQGTGCVTLAAIMAGLHVSQQKLKDVKLVVFGAGTAGVGIADQVRDAIASEKGISKDEAAKQIW
ncbi:hypothetical protein NPX13_g11076 [Xylaria arbuscula]|uniref:Malic enzyme n=1 Tax=Xylaria arbuscula TaxID=114810 RepID=A0A9W8TG78_9PEZI|nr:hypothetical protein NPX13_g11076 [Xylaria arbuscula]